MSQACPYCRETLAQYNLHTCPTCGTPHHDDCWKENGGCTVFGCQSAPADDPKIAVSRGDVGGAVLTQAGPMYYVGRNNQQLGPYTLPELHEHLRTRNVSETDLGWTQGMPNWVPISQLLRSPAPYSPSLIPQSFPSSVEEEDPVPGVMHFGRLLYIGSWIGSLFIMGALSTSETTAPLGLILYLAGLFTAGALRARDLGMSGWSVLLLIVPIANVWLGFQLAFAPRGYAITKKKDTALKVMTWVVIGTIALILLLALIGAMSDMSR